MLSIFMGFDSMGFTGSRLDRNMSGTKKEVKSEPTSCLPKETLQWRTPLIGPWSAKDAALERQLDVSKARPRTIGQGSPAANRIINYCHCFFLHFIYIVMRFML